MQLIVDPCILLSGLDANSSTNLNCFRGAGALGIYILSRLFNTAKEVWTSGCFQPNIPFYIFVDNVDQFLIRYIGQRLQASFIIVGFILLYLTRGIVGWDIDGPFSSLASQGSPRIIDEPSHMGLLSIKPSWPRFNLVWQCYIPMLTME